MSTVSRLQFGFAVLLGLGASLCIAGLAVAESTAVDMVDAAARAEKMGIVGFLSLVLIACIAGLIWLIHTIIVDMRALYLQAQRSFDHVASAVADIKMITLRCALAQHVKQAEAEDLARVKEDSP